MKKLLCLALVLAMCVSVFAGCGKFDVNKEDLSSYVTLGKIDEIPFAELEKLYHDYRAELGSSMKNFYLNAGYTISFAVTAEAVNADGTTSAIADWTYNTEENYVKNYDVFRYLENNSFDTALTYLVTDATVASQTPRLVRIGEAFSFTMLVPEDNTVSAAAGKTVKFTITVKEVLPAVYADSEITDKLQDFYDAYSVEKSVIEMGDSIQIDFTGKVDGESFQGGTARDYVLTVGEGLMIDGFEDQLVGHKNGERFDITVTFPADYDEPTLAGKEAVFSIKVDKIVNDGDIIADNSPFESLWELKEYYRLENYVEFAIVDYVASVSTVVSYPSKLLKTFEDIYEGYVAQTVAETLVQYTAQGEDYTKAEVKELLYPNGSDKTYVEENAKEAAYNYILVHLLLKEFELEYTDKKYQKDLNQLVSDLSSYDGVPYTAKEVEKMMGEELLRLSFIDAYLSEYLVERIVGAPEFRALETEE